MKGIVPWVNGNHPSASTNQLTSGQWNQNSSDTPCKKHSTKQNGEQQYKKKKKKRKKKKKKNKKNNNNKNKNKNKNNENNKNNKKNENKNKNN